MSESKTTTGGGTQGGRQRRAAGGRRRAFLVRVTDAQHQALIERASGIGVSVPRLMVEASLAGDGQTVSERQGLVVELSVAKRLTAAIGNNLNQLARAVNATGERPDELSVTLEATRRVMGRLEAAVRALDGRHR